MANTTEVQKRLKKWGYYTGVVDGINGPKTIAAVKKFQKRYGLTQDGIVGPLTAAKMGISVSSATSSSSYNSNDRYLLAKVIYAEARGEYAPATALSRPSYVERVSSLLCSRTGSSTRKS